jgi:hypothetical protein
MCPKSLDFWRHVENIDLLKGNGAAVGTFVCPRDATRVGLLLQWNSSLGNPAIAIGNKPGSASILTIQGGTQTVPFLITIDQIGLAITDLISVVFVSIDVDAKIFSLRYNPSNQ